MVTVQKNTNSKIVHPVRTEEFGILRGGGVIFGKKVPLWSNFLELGNNLQLKFVFHTSV